MEWQPIETAPKDGTVVNLNGDHELYPMRGLWQFGAWEAEHVTYTLGRERVIPDPTQWMPVSEVPNGDAPSSNGKTADFESANRGSSPRGASKP